MCVCVRMFRELFLVYYFFIFFMYTAVHTSEVNWLLSLYNIMLNKTDFCFREMVYLTSFSELNLYAHKILHCDTIKCHFTLKTI